MANGINWNSRYYCVSEALRRNRSGAACDFQVVGVGRDRFGYGRILTVDRRDFNVYRWNDLNLFENQLIR